MRILIDTNILLDYLVQREPYCKFSNQILAYCSQKTIDGFMAAHSVPDIFYILRKDLSENDRRELLLKLCRILKVEGLDGLKIILALNRKDFSDFEDCLQAECAAAVHADYIVTRNVKDFKKCSIPAVTAEEMCLKLSEA